VAPLPRWTAPRYGRRTGTNPPGGSCFRADSSRALRAHRPSETAGVLTRRETPGFGRRGLGLVGPTRGLDMGPRHWASTRQSGPFQVDASMGLNILLVRPSAAHRLPGKRWRSDNDSTLRP